MARISEGPGAPCDRTAGTTLCALVPTTSYSAGALLYDPTTGTIRSTGSMTEGRSNHTATLLSDGRVLIANGESNDGTAEVYDPKTGTFTRTGSMLIAAKEGTATLLSDGRVLFTGGNTAHNAGYSPTASAQLYDPKSGTFSPTGSMGTVRDGHTATLLNDGRVLVIGGQDGDLNTLRSAELYDPQSGTFGPTGSIVDLPKNSLDWGAGHLWTHTATLLADGRVLIANDGLAEVYLP